MFLTDETPMSDENSQSGEIGMDLLNLKPMLSLNI